LQSELAFAG